MKRRQSVYFLMTILLLLTTVFSVLSTIVPHQNVCKHNTCECCVEIEAAEKALFAAMEDHAGCTESDCTTCVFIEIQREVVQEKRAVEHSCHALACDSCIRMAIGKSIKAVVCIFATFMFACSAYRALRYVLSEKNIISKTFTLLAWKVRLND